jgi:hypothetical protein
MGERVWPLRMENMSLFDGKMEWPWVESHWRWLGTYRSLKESSHWAQIQNPDIVRLEVSVWGFCILD